MDSHRAKDRERQRRRYHERKRKGLCVRCAAKAVDGKTRCEQCESKRVTPSAFSQRVYYQRRRAMGLCVRCGQKATKGQSRCEECRKRGNMKQNRRRTENAEYRRNQQEASKKWYMQNRERIVAEKADKSATYFAEMAKRKRLRKAVGLCVDCGEESVEPPRVRCDSCSKRRRKKKARARRRKRERKGSDAQ